MLTLSITNLHPIPKLVVTSFIVLFCFYSQDTVSIEPSSPRTESGTDLSPPLHQVGLGDYREGYDSLTYQTDSKAIIETRGVGQLLNPKQRATPLGLPQLSSMPSTEEINLGRRLFFDRRLSANGTLSCGMCHIPEQGFTQNELATPVGHEGRSVRRNVPSLYNVAYVKDLFHDGREQSLEDQVWSPLLAANEMANESRTAVIDKIISIDPYPELFAAIYVDGITEESLGRAMAAYQRILLSADSAFDRWYYGFQNQTASPSEYPSDAIKGFALFRSTGCADCHQFDQKTALFTDGRFHNTGVGYRRYVQSNRPIRLQVSPGVFIKLSINLEVEALGDEGRAEITGRAVDRWRYRTPSLRNIALTAPYMHDGSIATLEEVVEFYAQGGGGDPKQDPRTIELTLSEDDQIAIVKFLKTLTSENVDALVSDARSIQIGDTSVKRE